MPIYRTGFASATPANAAAYATINSATRKAEVSQIDLSLITAVVSAVGYGTPANEATPPVVSTSITPVGRPSDIAATARIGTAWSTPPTAPSVMVDRKILAAVIGSGWTMSWPPKAEDEIKIGGWRVFWNDGGSTAGQLYITPTYAE